MRFISSSLLILFVVCEAESAPIIRGIAPNNGVSGETLTVRAVVEDISSFPDESEISFGVGIAVHSIVKQSFQMRRERRLLFLELEIEIDASASAGSRSVKIGDSSSSQASQFFVNSAPQISFTNFKQINSGILIPWRLLAENLDDDPLDELVSVNISPFAEGAVDVMDPSENKVQRIYSILSDGFVVSAREAVLADRDGDEILDLSILNWLQFDVLGGVIVQTRNTGDGTFEIVSDRPSRIGDLFIVSGNFNGDNFDDLAAVGFFGEIVVMPGDGKPNLRIKTLPKNFRGEVQNLAAGDVNRDGLDDLILAIDNEVSGKKEFAIVIANSDGTFQKVRRVALPQGEDGPWILNVSDLNHDGNVEFIFTSDQYRSLIIATYSNGNFSFRSSIRVECNAFSISDIDNDGDSDVACVGSDVDQIALFRSSGSSFLPRLTFTSPRYPVSIAIGDWNGDQKPDLATGFGKMFFPHPPNEQHGITLWVQR